MQDHRQVRPGLPARRRALQDGDVARVKGADPTTRADLASVQILADLAATGWRLEWLQEPLHPESEQPVSLLLLLSSERN